VLRCHKAAPFDAIAKAELPNALAKGLTVATAVRIAGEDDARLRPGPGNRVEDKALSLQAGDAAGKIEIIAIAAGPEAAGKRRRVIERVGLDTVIALQAVGHVAGIGVKPLGLAEYAGIHIVDDLARQI